MSAGPPQAPHSCQHLAALARPELHGRAAPLVPAPGGLDEARGPRAPLVRVEAEPVPDPRAVQSPELRRHEAEVVGDERERLDLGHGAHGAGGQRQLLRGGPRVQRPRQELLPAELAGADAARVEEARPPALRREGVEVAPDDEEHGVDGVQLPHQPRAARVQRRPQPLADRLQHPLVHLVEQGHPPDEVQAEVALDVAADVHGEVLEQGLFVDAARRHPLVLVVPPHALLQRLRDLPVVHPPLHVRPLRPPLLQPHHRCLEIRLLLFIDDDDDTEQDMSDHSQSPRILASAELLAYLHVADEQAKQHQPKNADDDREGYFADEQARRQILP